MVWNVMRDGRPEVMEDGGVRQWVFVVVAGYYYESSWVSGVFHTREDAEAILPELSDFCFRKIYRFPIGAFAERVFCMTPEHED